MNQALVRPRLVATILKIYEQTAGDILFQGKDVTQLKGKQLAEFRKDAQMISKIHRRGLNGRMKVRDIIAEGIDVNKLARSKAERDQKCKNCWIWLV